LKTLGLALTFFYVENISLPPEVEQAIDTRAKIGVLGDMNRYGQYQSATAIGDAAKNPGGAAGAGIGIGAGIALGQQMTAQMTPAAGAPALPVAFFIAENGPQTGPIDMHRVSGKAQERAAT